MRLQRRRLPIRSPARAGRGVVLASLPRAAATGAQAETDAAGNIRNLAIVLACVESIETGRQIEIG